MAGRCPHAHSIPWQRGGKERVLEAPRPGLCASSRRALRQAATAPMHVQQSKVGAIGLGPHFRGTNTAVGWMAPYRSGMLCPPSGWPPNMSRAPAGRETRERTRRHPGRQAERAQSRRVSSSTRRDGQPLCKPGGCHGGCNRPSCSVPGACKPGACACVFAYASGAPFGAQGGVREAAAAAPAHLVSAAAAPCAASCARW